MLIIKSSHPDKLTAKNLFIKFLAVCRLKAPGHARDAYFFFEFFILNSI